MGSNSSTSVARRIVRHRATPVIAAGVAVALAAGAVVSLGDSAAGAATTTYKAQSVGRFLDGQAGGKAIQSLADVQDARAKAPGTQSVQNALNATALGALKVPLGTALHLPGGGIASLGAANQVAVAKTTGYAYGGSGAVSNGGGVSLGGSNSYPSSATLDLSSAALGSVPIPGLPGSAGSTAAALGGVTATVGAVSGLAKTNTGGALATPTYQVAGLDLKIGSPALGALLSQLVAGGKQITTLLAPIISALKGLGSTLPAACNLTNGTLPTTISLDKGAVTVDPATATITVSVANLLKTLGLNINTLPPNTDLLAYVLNNLGTILSKGLENVVNGLIDPIQALGAKCYPALGALGTLLSSVLSTLKTGQAALEKAVNSIADELTSSSSAPLSALTSNLAKVAAIGVNVQQGSRGPDGSDGYPLSSEAKPTYKFTSTLKATPDQATSVVPGQGVERALEIDVLGGQVASLALGNAAAGPSTPTSSTPTTSTPTSSTPTTGTPTTAVPTGIPAGQARPDDGTPALPLVLVLLALLSAGGGAMAFRFRTRQSH